MGVVSTVPALPDVYLDPDSPRFLADPHAVYDALRPLAGPSGLVADALGWSTISYQASNAAFMDPALVPGIDPLLEELGFGALWGVPDHTLTDSEGESHQRLRRTVAPWFTPRRIGTLREYTRSLVADRLAPHRPDATIEVMSQVIDPVPAALFCAMAGTSPSDAPMLAQWSKALLLVFTATAGMVEPVRAAKTALAEYTHELLAHKRLHPGDDLATVLAQCADSGAISTEDAYYLLEELLSASVDNTANTTGCALHALAARPAAWRALHDDPDLVPNAVEECGRFEPAIRHTIKYAVADTSLEGVPVSAGDFVTIRIAAAHRDPAVYAAPHVLDIARAQPRPQLAFGAGRHYCLGAALARMEVQEMVSAITGLWASVEVADGARTSVVESGHVFALPLRSAS